MSALHNRQTHCQNKNAPVGLFQSHKGSKMINLSQHLSNTLLNCLIVPCLRCIVYYWSATSPSSSKQTLPGSLKVPLEAGSPNQAVSSFLFIAFLAKPVQTARGLCQLFKKLSGSWELAYVFQKVAFINSSNPGPFRTLHHNIFATLPLAHALILVCLRFGLNV